MSSRTEERQCACIGGGVSGVLRTRHGVGLKVGAKNRPDPGYLHRNATGLGGFAQTFSELVAAMVERLGGSFSEDFT